jgi:signal recognition particle GTPase
VIVPIRQQFGLTVKYLGMGEKAEDLALFQPDAFVDALFARIEDADAELLRAFLFHQLIK